MALTDTACKHAKSVDRARRLFDAHGLYLEVSPTGGKYWRLKYRFNDKEKRLALGVYPDVSLLQARKLRESARDLLRAGTDPGVAKRGQREQAKLNNAQTFEVIAREWHAHKKDGWESGTAKDKLHRLEKDVFPHMGSRPIASITPPQVLTVLRKTESRGALELTRRLKQTIGQDLPKGFQRAEFLKEHGFIDFIVDRRQLRPRLIQLLNLILETKNAA